MKKAEPLSPAGKSYLVTDGLLLSCIKANRQKSFNQPLRLL